MARKAMVPSKNSRQIVRPHVFNLGKTEATSIGKFGTHNPLVQKFPEFGAIFPQPTPSEGPTCRVRLWEGRTCRVRLLEGPACRVRRPTLDNPSRFNGHDERAPPTSAAALRSSRHLCKSARRTDLALTYEFSCAEEICQNLMTIATRNTNEGKRCGNKSGDLVANVDP